MKLHLKKQAETEAPETPTLDTDASAIEWLMPLRQALRTSLLAELDTRLQPTLGLLEAFTQEHTLKK